MSVATTYAERKAAGLCVRCAEPSPDATTCSSCRDRVNSLRAPARTRTFAAVAVSSWNVCCQAAGFHRNGCPNRATR